MCLFSGQMYETNYVLWTRHLRNDWRGSFLAFVWSLHQNIHPIRWYTWFCILSMLNMDHFSWVLSLFQLRAVHWTLSLEYTAEKTFGVENCEEKIQMYPASMCVTHVLLYNSSASAAEEYSDLMAIYGPQSQLCNPICFWKQMWHCETVFSHATLIKYCYYLTQLFKYTWCSHV